MPVISFRNTLFHESDACTITVNFITECKTPAFKFCAKIPRSELIRT